MNAYLENQYTHLRQNTQFVCLRVQRSSAIDNLVQSMLILVETQ